MKTNNQISKSTRIISWVLTGLSGLFLLFDAFGKFAKPAQVIDATKELNFPIESLTSLAIILLVSTVLYLIPRTAFLGAVLLTGYLGGAVATQFRLNQPLFSHTLFAVYVGIMVWGGLYLRSLPVRRLFANGSVA